MTLAPAPAEQLQLLLRDLLPTQYQQLTEESPHHRADWAAHMTPNPAPYSLIGMQLAAMHNGNLLSAELYPLLAQAERATTNWLKKHFHFPQLNFTQSGTYSNLEALWQARELHSGDNPFVYGSRASHYSLKKACHILGLQWVEIDTDGQDRIDLSQLRRACEQQPPMLIVANFGTSSIGAIDPWQDIADIAHQYQSWLHVDACWGGAVLLAEHYPPISADSLSFDPHKGLFVPRPCSALLSRHQFNAEKVDYLQSPPAMRLTGSYGGEMFLPLWLNLTLLGEDWFFEKIHSRLQQAQQLTEQLRQFTGWPTWHAGTGIVVFSPEKDLSRLVSDGVLSTTRLNGKLYYRAVFASYATRADAIIKALHPYF